MKEMLMILLGSFLLLTGCNNKPEIISPAAGLIIYPNPTVARATIEVNNLGKSSFSLRAFDTNGNIILTETGDLGGQSFNLDIADKPKGKYQIILKTDKLVSTQTLIKL